MSGQGRVNSPHSASRCQCPGISAHLCCASWFRAALAGHQQAGLIPGGGR